MPIQALYREAEALLRPLAFGYAVPLRLDEGRGQLLSALPRLLRAKGLDVVCPSLPEGSAFSALEEVNGMLVFSVSEAWCSGALEAWNALPWEDLPEQTGVRRNDSSDEAFLISYTIRRCRRYEAHGQTAKLEPSLILGLLGKRDSGALARQYWRLPPHLRQDSLLAGAVGKVLCRCFTKNSPLCSFLSYNEG